MYQNIHVVNLTNLINSKEPAVVQDNVVTLGEYKIIMDNITKDIIIYKSEEIICKTDNDINTYKSFSDLYITLYHNFHLKQKVYDLQKILNNIFN